MRGKRRKITPEQQEYLSHLGINEDDRNGRYYRKDLADMQEILDTNGHETPNEADYRELRKQRKNDTEFKSSRSRIEQYFQYKAEKGRQINMFDNETQEPRTDNQDLAGALTEHDEQPSTDIQEPQTVEAENDSMQEAQTHTVNEAESKRPVGRPKSASTQDKKFFNLQLPPNMRNDLDILALYDECSITDIILTATAEYINMRREDIDYQIQYTEQKKIRKAKRYTQ